MFMNYIIRQLEEVLESYLMILFKYIFFKTSLQTITCMLSITTHFEIKLLKLSVLYNNIIQSQFIYTVPLVTSICWAT